MNIDTPEEEVEPVICDICNEEIKIGDKFLEVETNKGLKRHSRGYIKGGSIIWDTDTSYIHLKHTLYAMVSE